MGVVKSSATIFMTILLTGIVLDELGSGKFGPEASALARKVTRGYGV